MTTATADQPHPLRMLWRSGGFTQRLAAVIGILLIAAALLAPLLAPYEPTSQSLLSRLRPPLGMEGARAGYILGTDELGRDILSRALYGLRLTLTLAFLGATLGLILGGTLGLLAGMRGGRIDAFIMGLVDTQIAIPFTLIALFLLTILGNSLEVMVLVLGLSGWEQYARIIRADVARLMRLPFIEAARCAGASTLRIGARHLLPNVVSPLVVQFTLSLSSIILLESTLSFLGLGVQPPTATLRAMVGVGRDYLATAPWIVLVPSFLILAVTFSAQILGDWLRDRVDVRLRSR